MTKVPTVAGPPLAERMIATAIAMENCTDLTHMGNLYRHALNLLLAAAPVVMGEQREALQLLDEVQGSLAVVRAALGSEVVCRYCGEELS